MPELSVDLPVVALAIPYSWEWEAGVCSRCGYSVDNPLCRCWFTRYDWPWVAEMMPPLWQPKEVSVSARKHRVTFEVEHVELSPDELRALASDMLVNLVNEGLPYVIRVAELHQVAEYWTSLPLVREEISE